MQFNIPSEHKNASGVYIIRNSVNEKVYVGSAVRLRSRYLMHRQQLRNAKHHSRHLQRFVNKYGIETLSFELLELSEPALNVTCEQKWLDLQQAYAPGKGFNIASIAGSTLGVKYSAEIRRKQSEARKGKVFSEEHRHNLSEALKGRIHSEEALRKMSQASKREALSEETLRKMSQASKGRIRSDEARRKQSETNRKRGVMPNEENLRLLAEAAKRPKSAEHRSKLSEAHKGKKRFFSEEHCRNLSNALKGRVSTEETRRKMSEAAKRRAPISEETRRRRSEGLKASYLKKRIAMLEGHK